MAIVALKCPHCGGDLSFEDSREFGFCEFCGSKIMIQQEINNITNITNNISDLGSSKAGRFKQVIRTHIDNGNYKDAEDVLVQLGNIDDTDPEYILLKMEITYCNHFNQHDLFYHTEELISLYSDYIKFSGTKRSFDDILNSFNMPPYDYEADLKKAAAEDASAKAGQGLYEQYDGPYHTWKDNDKQIVEKNYMQNWAKVVAVEISEGRPFAYNLVLITILKHIDAKCFDDIIKNRPEYAAGSVIYDYAYPQYDNYKDPNGSTCIFGYKRKFYVDPIFMKDGNPAIVPETIEKYRANRASKKFMKGLLSKKPDEKKQKQWDDETESNVAALTKFYNDSYDFIYNHKIEEKKKKLPEWFAAYNRSEQ